jgi:putative transposase
MRIVHYSVQSNHIHRIHLILEAEDQKALSRGMRGLTIRLARAINRVLGRRGKVFADHYYARELRTPAEVRRAIRYVLDNAMLHAGGDPQTDPCASTVPLVAPHSWLLRIGAPQSRRTASGQRLEHAGCERRAR